jgi:ATP-dependent Clp protease ATP-binding subunit ClpC
LDTLTLSEKALYCRKGFDKQFGARPLKRAIQKYVEDSLAEEIITSKISIRRNFHGLKKELKS